MTAAKAEIITANFGRTDDAPIPLPMNIEAEQALLAALLVDNAIYAEVGHFLGPEHFASTVHSRIYDAIGRLIDDGREANPTTLASFFANDAFEDVGGAGYLQRLALSMVTLVNAQDYARTIVDMWQRRQLIATLSDVLEDAFAPDPDRSGAEVVADCMASLERMGQAGPFQFRTARQVRVQAVEDMKREVPCTTTGFPRLDRAMGGGLYAGKMYGIVARKKAGKTLAGSGIAHAASAAGPVLYVAGEMGAEGIEQRRWAAEMRRNSLSFLTDTKRDPAFLTQAADHAIGASENLLYAHLPGLTFDRLRRALATFVMRHHGGRGVVIDYLQLIRGRERHESGADFTDRVAQWIADFCAERKIWAVVLAQENQTGNVRGGEGLRLACDMCFELCRTADENGNEGEGNEAWLHMIETRYTPWTDVGSQLQPALRLETRTGPFYTEIASDEADDNAKLFSCMGTD